NAHLFKYDSTYGRFDGEVSSGDGVIRIDGHEIRTFSEKDPAALPWGDLGVAIVIESTGAFTDATKAAAHRQAGARTVIIRDPAGKFDGFSLRGPTPTVSVNYLVVLTSTPVTREAANDALNAAAAGPMQGLLGIIEEPLVSMDFKGDDRSSIVDGLSTMVTGENLLKVIAWYDNEWGYSCRVADLTSYIAARL